MTRALSLLREAPTRRDDGFQFGRTVLEGVRARRAEAEGRLRSMRAYAELMPEPGVGPLRFGDFPFQEEWYTDEVSDAGEVVFAKGAQVGASAYGVRWCIRQVDQLGDTGLYVMPTDGHVHTFGDERIEPAIEESPYLQTRIRGKFVRNKKLKRIGRAFLHLRGSNSKAGAQSVAAQFLFLDERDLLDQTNVPQIMRRVSGARQLGKTPRVRSAGYPLLPNSGIDKLFTESDQRVWHIICQHCGDEQPVTWEDNVRWRSAVTGRVCKPGDDEFEDRDEVGEVWRQCRACEQSLEDSAPEVADGALRTGRWIPQRPNARRRIGYHVWRGMVPTTDLQQLVIASRGTSETEQQAFEELDLGRAYAAGESSLTDADLLRACAMGAPQVAYYGGGNATTMGVDVAGERDLNYWIDEQLPAEQEGMLNPRRALAIGRAKSFEEIRDLMDRYRVHICVVDANPERRMARTLRATYPGRVVLCEFDHNLLGEPVKLDVDEVNVPLKAKVHRTDAIDAMMDGIRQCRARPVSDPPPGWAGQMKALHRRTELDTKGRPVRRYITTGTQGDDYALTATYAMVATELWRVFVHLRQQMADQGRHVPDEEMGFQRVRLDDGYDDYRPGLGGE